MDKTMTGWLIMVAIVVLGVVIANWIAPRLRIPA